MSAPTARMGFSFPGKDAQGNYVPNPFIEQIDFFRQKLNLPSERWDDITRSAHDRAFIVAGAMKADLLDDLNKAVTKAIEQGKGLEEFRKDFAAIVQKHGWTGWTGEGTPGGEAWRTKVIYQTNLSTSYAAGRYKQLTDPEFLKLRPYWRYVHNDSVMHPRPLHQAWGNMRLTLRYDHPFWQTHFPPNGWSCFPANTLVRCDAQIGLKTWYSGEMVELHTGLGHRLTLTANHPVMSSRGWLPAHAIKNGDQLIGASSAVDSMMVGVVNNEQSPVSAEDLFQTLAAQGLRIVPMTAHDFHGDTRLREPEIHIAGSDRVLMDVIHASLGQHLGKTHLEAALHGRIEPASVSSGSPFAAMVFNQAILSQDAANGRLGETDAACNLRLADRAGAVHRKNLALSVGVPRVGNAPSSRQQSCGFSARFDADPSPFLAVGKASNSDATAPQDAPQRVTAGVQVYRELLETNPGLVSADKIILVRKFNWSGHVYDFSTQTGLIVAGGLLVSNCHCRVVPVEAPQDGDATEPPEGWGERNSKGNLPGIDKGFDYAPGASVSPLLRAASQKLDSAPRSIARDYCDYLRSTPAFERFINGQLAGEFPVAVLDEATQSALGSDAHVVLLSQETAAAHIAKHPEITALDYRKIQNILDRGDIYRNGDERLVYLWLDGALYRAVIKRTQVADKNYFLTLFKSSEEKADREIRNNLERIR